MQDQKEAYDKVEGRLRMARAWVGMLTNAYNAFKTHGVDLHALPEYKDTTLLTIADQQSFKDGMQSVFAYLERVEHGIRAAVNRKQFKRVT